MVVKDNSETEGGYRKAGFVGYQTERVSRIYYKGKHSFEENVK